MATIFLEPGGDADFGVGLWTIFTGTPAVATDFVHGSHIKSIKYRPGNSDVLEVLNSVADAGGRYSVWIYFATLPSGTSTLISIKSTANAANIIRIRITSTGVLQLWDDSVQQGSNGSTLSTGVWYRLSFAWKITSSTVNEARMWKNGILDITFSNVTLSNTGSADWKIGNLSGDASLDIRTSDHYLDNSNALTDPGNIWVTAKRPFSNGTTNGFTTQIGSGGSGYGSGHSPQVNERPNSDSNGWSIVTVASAITEEYNIESAATGDIDISTSQIIDYMGWLRTKALNAETGKIILNNVQTSISITTSIAYFTKIAGSTTYPAGTGTDIGEVSAAVATTISLYECGIIVAYIPPSNHNLALMGVGS